MKSLRYFGVALDSIRAHKLRAVLTMLGIIIGITAVLVTVAIGSGAALTLAAQLPSNVAPAYSPDGQHIVFLSNRTDSGEAGAWRLWVMDADGGNQQPLPVDVLISYNFGAEQVVSWGP